jgi:hypothetical protein
MMSKVASRIAHIQVGRGGTKESRNIMNASAINTDKNIITKSRTGDLVVICSKAIPQED